MSMILVHVLKLFLNVVPMCVQESQQNNQALDVGKLTEVCIENMTCYRPDKSLIIYIMYLSLVT